jgi:MOSC domain-containing protein YiiM
MIERAGSEMSKDARAVTAAGPSPDSPIGRLLAGPVRPGQVTWIGLRPARRAPVLARPTVRLVAGKGIEGDHYDTTRDGPRQVTLIATEDLAAIAAFLGMAAVPPEVMRRNFATRGINLFALKDRRFRVGRALLEGSGECAPCSLMEAALGPGGYNAVRGHGGICARVIDGGDVDIGDSIERVDPVPRT